MAITVKKLTFEFVCSTWLASHKHSREIIRKKRQAICSKKQQYKSESFSEIISRAATADQTLSDEVARVGPHQAKR